MENSSKLKGIVLIINQRHQYRAGPCFGDRKFKGDRRIVNGNFGKIELLFNDSLHHLQLVLNFMT